MIIKEGEPLEPPDHLREINKDLYISFSAIALSGINGHEGVWHKDFWRHTGREGGNKTEVGIEFILNNNMELSDFIARNAPESFKAPFVAVGQAPVVWPEDQIVDTPYGRMPRSFIGTDGEEVNINNAFLINGLGQAMKSYEIIKYPQDEADLLKQRMNLFLKEEQGLMTLTEGDYELLGRILQEIATGELATR